MRFQKARVAEEQERLDDAGLVIVAVLCGLAGELVETDGKKYHTGKASDKDLGADDALRGRNVTTRRSHGILSCWETERGVETGHSLRRSQWISVKKREKGEREGNGTQDLYSGGVI